MAHHTMEHNNGNGNVLMLVLTLFIYLISVWSVQQWAAIATIVAALSTAAFNIYKWWAFSRDKRKEKDIIDNN